jgi:hypothetical protein
MQQRRRSKNSICNIVTFFGILMFVAQGFSLGGFILSIKARQSHFSLFVHQAGFYSQASVC